MSARGYSLVAVLTLAIFALSLAVTFPPSPRSVPAEEPDFEIVKWTPPRRGDTLIRGTPSPRCSILWDSIPIQISLANGPLRSPTR